MLIYETLLLLILLLYLGISHANQIDPHHCSPSACGIIHNISFPFRLKHDPKHCGYPDYELACQNNVTSLDLNSQKYIVKAINYNNRTIRLADVSIGNNICSFPKYSAYRYNFSVDVDNISGWRFSGDGHDIAWPIYFGWRFSGDGHDIAWPIYFMSCPYALSSSLLTEATACFHGENAVKEPSSRHTYIRVGRMNVSDVKPNCRVDLIVMTSWKFEDLKNVKLSEIHEALLYGFELSWLKFRCGKCELGETCIWSADDTVTCVPSLHIVGIGTFVILLLLIVVAFAGASLIVTAIIIAFACLWGYYFFIQSPTSIMYLLEWKLLDILCYIGAINAAMKIMSCPCLMGLLIYKFRRRHLSMFHAIESFLRSDNKLVPIRYSYPGIKKITRGFHEKLGQGGYGSVYKGKLRSGDYVAVKLLEKPRENGQDFMNEIATIGRIHHVNIVKLVGYCAEGSKRALVYDFMPNGSLEKYICNRENMNSLNWITKFDIAVGVARGIEYLHRGCDIQILHFDIKPQNILLDDKFIPKISDFGLAKYCSTEKKTVTLTAARGTIGYVAPELINRGIGGVSYKADVYSFGMLLIEMVGLKRDLRAAGNGSSSQYFPNWIYERFNLGEDIEIERSEEDDDDDGMKIAKKMTIVALWCIQMSPDDRPSMNKVLDMLEGDAEHLQIPHHRSFQGAVREEQSWSAYTADSESVQCDDTAPSFEITVED